MCSISSTDEAHKVLGTLSDKSKIEKDLARKAEADTIEEANGLYKLMKPIKSWRSTDLRDVRKYRRGRHRFYIRGHHKHCRYILCFIIPSKREDDREEELNFQRKVLQLSLIHISEPTRRT